MMTILSEKVKFPMDLHIKAYHVNHWLLSFTTVWVPCLVMLQRVSRSYKGNQILEKCDCNEEAK